MPGIIHDITLRVADLSRSLQFYVDLMGFRKLEQTQSLARLGVPGSDDPVITLEHYPGAVRKPRRSTGLYHVAIRFPTRRDLAAAFMRLHRAGLPFQGFSDHAVSEAVYLPDPDGNGLELYVDRSPDTWRYMGDEVSMTTLPLDLDDLLAELSEAERAGDLGAVPAGTDIGHIHLHVADLQQAESFYVDLLGFDVMQRSYPGVLFISSHGYHHHLGLNVWAGEGAPQPPAEAVGLVGYTISAPNDQPADTVVARLRDAGWDVAEDEDGWVAADPVGIKVRVRNGSV